jgi:hypothetical protein
MMVTPQLSAEIEKLLPQVQRQLTEALKQAPSSMTLPITPKEFESIIFSVGDISLLVKRAETILR